MSKFNEIVDGREWLAICNDHLDKFQERSALNDISNVEEIFWFHLDITKDYCEFVGLIFQHGLFYYCSTGSGLYILEDNDEEEFYETIPSRVVELGRNFGYQPIITINDQHFNYYGLVNKTVKIMYKIPMTITNENKRVYFPDDASDIELMKFNERYNIGFFKKKNEEYYFILKFDENGRFMVVENYILANLGYIFLANILRDHDTAVRLYIS